MLGSIYTEAAHPHISSTANQLKNENSFFNDKQCFVLCMLVALVVL